jgi:hypothetical protein
MPCFLFVITIDGGKNRPTKPSNKKRKKRKEGEKEKGRA